MPNPLVDYPPTLLHTWPHGVRLCATATLSDHTLAQAAADKVVPAALQHSMQHSLLEKALCAPHVHRLVMYPHNSQVVKRDALTGQHTYEAHALGYDVHHTDFTQRLSLLGLVDAHERFKCKYGHRPNTLLLPYGVELLLDLSDLPSAYARGCTTSLRADVETTLKDALGYHLAVVYYDGPMTFALR